MRIRGIGRLRRVARGVTNIFVPRALILLYHRVTELPSDPQLLCVSRQHFAEHLEVLQKHGQPMRLKTLDSTLKRQTMGRCAIVLTFDDGYADNLYNAKPLLERYDIPATVFVATGYIGSKREFWQDDLERLFLQPGMLPKTLRLNINGDSFQWELGEASYYSEDTYRRHCLWKVSEKHDPTMRHYLYRVFMQMLLPLPDRERQKVLDDLLAWTAVETTGRPTHRTLSPEELIRLGDGGLVEIGSHTVTHPVLSALPVAEQRDEISGSKARLEAILGHPIASFAYPYGGQSHYTSDTVAAVREVGYDCACSNFCGIVRRGVDPWQLPRFLVRDWDGEEFSCRLREWLRD